MEDRESLKIASEAEFSIPYQDQGEMQELTEKERLPEQVTDYLEAEKIKDDNGNLMPVGNASNAESLVTDVSQGENNAGVEERRPEQVAGGAEAKAYTSFPMPTKGASFAVPCKSLPS